MQNQQPAPTPSPTAAAADDARMDWWRDARFGMFIHWGLYAIPAGKWGDETNHAEWIRATAKIPLEEYDRLAARFNPVKFDADAWAALAKEAGCRYIVITSKHHDGFCLFDSAHTDFDVMSTPFKRDIMREIAEASRRHGIVPCWYHSIMDWHHPDYLPRRDWEKDRPTEGADFERFNRYLKDQVAELLTKYGPIGVMWFDGEWESTWTHERGADLYNHCRALQPSVIVNNRVGKSRDGMAGLHKAGEKPLGDFGTPEQEIPATGIPGLDWETCMTMNEHWGYNAADKNYKSTKELIHSLCDIASKGGNFLLNVGPTAEGEIPPESVERLREIGRWMRVNGEAIYGTRASPIAGLAWGRCTSKRGPSGTTLYLHVFEWPESGALRIDGLAGTPARAYLLADRSRRLETSRDEHALVIRVPSSAPDPICSVVVLEFAGEPEVYHTPAIEAASDTFIRPLTVTLSTPNRGVELRYTTDGSEPTGASPVYSSPLRISAPCTLRARAFKGGRPVSATRMRTFSKAEPYPAMSVTPGTTGSLFCEVYSGERDRIPDFKRLTPERTKAATRIRPDTWTDERIGYRFSGYIRIPHDDVYLFSLTSDDGARLIIDGHVVIDNDGLHSAVEKRAESALAAGWHSITVEWFNRTDDATLSVKYAPAGETLKALPAEMTAH